MDIANIKNIDDLKQCQFPELNGQQQAGILESVKEGAIANLARDGNLLPTALVLVNDGDEVKVAGFGLMCENELAKERVRRIVSIAPLVCVVQETWCAKSTGPNDTKPAEQHEDKCEGIAVQFYLKSKLLCTHACWYEIENNQLSLGEWRQIGEAFNDKVRLLGQ